jgi:DNA repair protein RadA/Sms
VRIDEPGADLAIALAIASAAKNRPVRDRTAAFGEIGLTGRLRVAAQAERRLEECGKLGLLAAIVPRGTAGSRETGPTGRIRLQEAETLKQAIGAALDAGEDS